MAIHRTIIGLGCTAIGLAVCARGPAVADDGERGPVKPKVCTTHKTEAPYRNYGYDHIVVLTNTCDHVEHCVIESASIETPEQVDVPAKEEVSVLLRRGSPAREFAAKVTCTKK